MPRAVLDFEKPIIDLEEKIAEMKKFSNHLDIGDEIAELEKKVKQLQESVFTNPISSSFMVTASSATTRRLLAASRSWRVER